MAKKLIFPAPLQVQFEDVPAGDPAPNQVRVRAVVSGVSHGTEMTGYTGASPFVRRALTPERTFRDKTDADPSFYPFRYAGYDSVGLVEAVGRDVNGLAVGDRVWVAQPHQDVYLAVPGAGTQELVKLDPAVPDEDAIMLNLTSVALCAVNDAQIKIGDAAVVFGGGIVGQLAVQLCRIGGARQVILVEPLESRRKFALERTPGLVALDPRSGTTVKDILHANGGASPDVVIECSGSVRGLQGAVQAAGVAGTVVAAGFYAGPADAIVLGEEFLHNRVTLKASMGVWGCPSRWPERWDRPRIVRETHHLLASRRLRLDGFVTARFPFLQAQQAYESIRLQPERYLKVALTY